MEQQHQIPCHSCGFGIYPLKVYFFRKNGSWADLQCKHSPCFYQIQHHFGMENSWVQTNRLTDINPTKPHKPPQNPKNPTGCCVCLQAFLLVPILKAELWDAASPGPAQVAQGQMVATSGCAPAAGWFSRALSPCCSDKALPAGCTAQGTARAPSGTQPAHPEPHQPRDPFSTARGGRRLQAWDRDSGAHPFPHHGCCWVWSCAFTANLASWALPTETPALLCTAAAHAGMDLRTLLHHQPGFTQALLIPKAMPNAQGHSLVRFLNPKYILFLKKTKIFTSRIIA